MQSKMRSSDVLQAARHFRVSSSKTSEAIYHFLSAINTPRALTVWLLFRFKEHDQLTELDIDPDMYENAYRFRLDYVATLFLSKAKFLRTSFDRAQVAQAKFLKFEDLCRETNRRFVNPHLDPLNRGANVWLLNAVKRKIVQVLGDFSPDEFVDNANWGPGNSTLLRGEEVSAYNKFHDERGITRDLYDLVNGWFSTAYPLWWKHISGRDEPFIMEPGNVIVTVPKSSKTDRVIAMEPGINLWFQKAIGSMLRRRLRRFGIDLNTQEINQSLARQGSLNSDIATIDFSSASDSISRELVRELLPPRWYLLLDACRSKVGRTLDGTIVKWEKFSSMGNGFTFELESLIFFCAAQAVKEFSQADGPISVFGDDVILPVECSTLFVSFSEFLGFRVNKEKSFFSRNSHFRESCGSHYFSGVDCKPVFLKERLTHVETIYKLANGVRNLAHRCNFYRSCDARFLDCWTHLLLWVPETLRLRVPRSAGDVGFASNFDEARPARARYGIEGYYYRALVSVGITRQGDGLALLLARLRNPSTLERNNKYDLRGRTRRAVASLLVSQWYNLGGWE